MPKKIVIVSYESSAGRTTLALGLFLSQAGRQGFPMQLISYDIEKPDMLEAFGSARFDATEIYADFPKIDKNYCRYCGACVGFCSCNALVLDRNIPSIYVDPDRCEACGDCLLGCNIHGITTKERFTGYILHAKLNGHAVTIGKGDTSHDYMVPLVCALNTHLVPGVHAICDLPPGISGFVMAALKNADLAIVVIKPSRGWKRNIAFLQSTLSEKKVRYGLLINKYRNETGFLDEIRRFCSVESIPLLGIIPFHAAMTSLCIEASPELAALFMPVWDRIHETLT